MGRILGIIGGGQLGMMLTEAATKMKEQISEIIVLDPTPNCPAAKAGAKQIVGDFKDKKGITELAEKSNCITYEIESGDSKILKSLEDKTTINPSPETLRIIQDKFLQKSFLSENNIPVPEFEGIDSIDKLREKIRKFGYPALLKARRDAYDGKGNFKISSEDQIGIAFDYFKGSGIMLEKFVNFKMEVSVVAARNTKGDIATYPVVENIHQENILEMTIAPARVSEEIAQKAKKIAYKTMDVLKGAGVFGIEMFVTTDDQILINEIAPRVHNSGHHTLQSCKTSQFEQHLRAILGLDLGSTEIIHPTIMCNILGPKNFSGKYRPVTIDSENIFLKMYQKAESKPQRKLGHFNLVSKNGENIDELIRRAQKIKEKISIQSAS